MEKGKIYRIWYIDDTGQTRERKIKLIRETDKFLIYINLQNSLEQGIKIDWLQRFEAIKNGVVEHGIRKEI